MAEKRTPTKSGKPLRPPAPKKIEDLAGVDATPAEPELSKDAQLQAEMAELMREREEACRREVDDVMRKHRCTWLVERREFSGHAPDFFIHFKAQ